MGINHRAYSRSTVHIDRHTVEGAEDASVLFPAFIARAIHTKALLWFTYDDESSGLF
jgi:hypothetical protein